MADSLRILVVEDNPVNQKLLTMMLDQFGHSSVIAVNGREAVEWYQRHSFDLILMDIQMPEMDGFAATAAIRSLEAEQGNDRIPIVAVTAHVTPGYREKCLAGGMDGYVPKPFRIQEIREAIAQAMASVGRPH